MPERIVKLGRQMIAPPSPVAHHWAIQVGDVWYEIAPKQKQDGRSPNRINRNHGDQASSGAGKFGGEIVGKTDKTDSQIDSWLERWLDDHPDYDFMEDNCQKLAYEFMMWLTDNNYRCDHRVDAGNIDTKDREFWAADGFAAAKGGNAIASVGLGQGHVSKGPFNMKIKVGQASAQAVAGPGFGAFADATAFDASYSAGNIIGLHVGLNANTGAGARNGNLEAHLLGFGGKIGADGLEINTPIGGVNACSVM
jgi:hypothetical protein